MTSPLPSASARPSRPAPRNSVGPTARTALLALAALAALTGCPPRRVDDFDVTVGDAHCREVAPFEYEARPDDAGRACVRLEHIATSRSDPANVSVFFRAQTCGGEPIAGLDESQLQFLEDGQAISEVGSAPRLVCDAARFRSYSLLLLDFSGVVATNQAAVQALHAAVASYAQSLITSSEHRLAVYAFDGRAEIQLIVDFTSNANTVQTAITRLSCTNPDLCLDTSINLNGALVRGIEALDLARREARTIDGVEFTLGNLTVFSAGADEAARVTRDVALARAMAPGEQVAIHTIGVGPAADATFLREVARVGHGTYAPVTDYEGIGNAFAQVGARTSALAASYYRLEYCSPRRAGTHAVTVRLAVPGLAAELSTMYSAEGFGGTCGRDL